MKGPTVIQSLNILKFIMAIFVIASHTLCLAGMTNFISSSYFLKYILRLAVPVFFIISGYLLFRKMNLYEGKVDNKRIGRYVFRIFVLYAVFYLLYSLIAWYVANQAGIGFGDFLKYQIKKFFFVGESAYSWALWYLHGLILAVLMVWGILKLFPRIRPIALLIVAIIIWMVGAAAEMVGSEKMGVIPGYDTFIFLFERVQRNGIFTGLPFVALGLWLSQVNLQKSKYVAMGGICVALGAILGMLGLDFGRLPLALGMVILSLYIEMRDRRIYDILGFSSKWMFLLHMAFLFMYTVLVMHRTDSTMGGYEWGLFGFVLGCSLVSSLIIWAIKTRIGNIGRRSRYKKHPKPQRSE